MRRPPYAPFLAGAPDFIPGLKPIALDAWLTPDTEAASLPDKRVLLRDHRADVFCESETSRGAQAEIGAAIGAALGVGIGDDPLIEASALVSDDLVIMQPTPEGWRVSALTLCSPTYFSAAFAIGKSMVAIHDPVPDRLGPGGTQQLGARIDRMFSNLQPDTVLERFNWTVQAGPARYTPDRAPLTARALAMREEDALDDLHLRVERQTIRAFTENRAVLFTIRIALDPLRAVFAEPGWRGAFATAWRDTAAHVRGYKKWGPLERLVAAALES